MGLKHHKNIKEEIVKLMKDTINRETKAPDIFVVTGVNTDGTCNIKQLNVNLQFDNVESISPGLGHLKGQIMLPSVGDLVIVMFVSTFVPMIIGSIYNKYVTDKDERILLSEGEWFVSNKANSAYIFMDSDGNIKISSPTKITLDSPAVFGGDTPIGSRVIIEDGITGVPALQSNWLVCDGSVIDDPDSPIDGETLPNLSPDTWIMKIK